MTATLEETVPSAPPAKAASGPWSGVVNKLISVLGSSDLSAALGVSRTTIYIWSRGKCEPRFESKQKLTELFKSHVPGQENAALEQLDPRLDSSVTLEQLQQSRRPWQILAQKIVAAHQANVDVAAQSIGVKSASLRGWTHGRRPHSAGRSKLAGAFGLSVADVDPAPVSSRTRRQQVTASLGEAAELFIASAKLLTDSVRDEGCVAVDQLAADKYLEDVQGWLQSAKSLLA